MNINATLFVEVIIFLVFVILTMKYVWPPIHDVLEERRRLVQEGLDQAEKSRKKLAQARSECQSLLAEAKQQARDMLAHTEERIRQTLDQTHEQAEQERQKIVERAQGDIEQQRQHVYEELLSHVTDLTMKATKAVLQDKVDVNVDKKLIDKVIEESDR